jgi:hypothetical protein
VPTILYILTNEAMPDLIKIGLTTDSVETRIRQLSLATGVPLPFECYFAAEVENAVEKEKILHQLFGDYRINPKREFFSVDPEKVVLAISMGGYKEVTPGETLVDDPEENEALESAKAKRPNLQLSKIGINPGAELTFSRDENVRAKVVENNKVEFEGQVMSLAKAALLALQKMGYKTTSVSGSNYWMFQGKLLDERRREIEQNASSDATVVP